MSFLQWPFPLSKKISPRSTITMELAGRLPSSSPWGSLGAYFQADDAPERLFPEPPHSGVSASQLVGKEVFLLVGKRNPDILRILDHPFPGARIDVVHQKPAPCQAVRALSGKERPMVFFWITTSCRVRKTESHPFSKRQYPKEYSVCRPCFQSAALRVCFHPIRVRKVANYPTEPRSPL